MLSGDVDLHQLAVAIDLRDPHPAQVEADHRSLPGRTISDPHTQGSLMTSDTP
jgi:hypothetical protein